MFDRLLWWGEALKAAGQRRTPRAAKGATVYGLGATVRAHVRRVSEEPHPVRWPGVAVAVQKVASSMKIAARKTNARGLCAPPGSAQKARVNSAAKPSGNARK
jgi:hypothetical protein